MDSILKIEIEFMRHPSDSPRIDGERLQDWIDCHIFNALSYAHSLKGRSMKDHLADDNGEITVTMTIKS